MFRKQKQSFHPYTTDVLRTFVVHIKLSNQDHGFAVDFKVGTDRLPVVQDTLDAGTDQQSRNPWARWSSQC